MSTIGDILRDEIRRLARKEMRKAYPDMPELSKRISVLERSVDKLNKEIARISPGAGVALPRKRIEQLSASEETLEKARLSPRLINKCRKKLKLSMKDFARLAGVSSVTVYQWEKGKVKPSKRARAVLVGLRKLSWQKAKKLLSGGQPEISVKK